jgi:F-type H+-transporting ATPase subunit b
MLIVLNAWVYKPLVNMLEKRKETITKGLEDARVATEARANAETEAEKVLAEAQGKASEILREATSRAEEATRDIKAAAEKEAADARKDALADIEQERDAILGEVRGQVASLAMAATQKLIGEALDEKRQRALVDEFFSGIKAGKVVVAEEVTGDALVTSALPLTDAEQKTVMKTLKGEIEFKVDPKILGGLVIRVGDKVLDGSVAGKLDAMHQSLS